MEVNPKPCLSMTIAAELMPGFVLLFQSGALFRAGVGCSVMSFFRDQLKLDSEFIEHQIQTVFLDGKPVDDLESATVKDGCTLALSSAMPGLVGATMRRGGFYAPFRKDISHSEQSGGTCGEEGQITVKLFNLVASELGPALFEKGVLVKGEALKDFLDNKSAGFWSRCKAIRMDGKSVNGPDLKDMNWQGQPVLIFVSVGKQA